MDAVGIVNAAMEKQVDELRRPCGVAEKAAVLNRVRESHPEIVPILEVDRLVGEAVAERIREEGRALSLEEVQGIKAEVEARWTDGMEWKAEERQKLKRYSLSMARKRLKLARKADRDGRTEEAVEWYGGAVWFLNRYWPNRAEVVGNRMDELRLDA